MVRPRCERNVNDLMISSLCDVSVSLTAASLGSCISKNLDDELTGDYQVVNETLHCQILHQAVKYLYLVTLQVELNLIMSTPFTSICTCWIYSRPTLSLSKLWYPALHPYLCIASFLVLKRDLTTVSINPLDLPRPHTQTHL